MAAFENCFCLCGVSRSWLNTSYSLCRGLLISHVPKRCEALHVLYLAAMPNSPVPAQENIFPLLWVSWMELSKYLNWAPSWTYSYSDAQFTNTFYKFVETRPKLAYPECSDLQEGLLKPQCLALAADVSTPMTGGVGWTLAPTVASGRLAVSREWAALDGAAVGSPSMVL